MLRRVFGKVGVVGLCVCSSRFSSTRNKVLNVEDAVSLIKNESVITVSGFVTHGCPEEILLTIGRRYEQTGEPKDLTLVFEGGPGDYGDKGMNHLAKPGLLKRSIGSHYGQTPLIGKLVLEGQIEGYNFPMGAISRMMRCGASGQPYHISPIGLNTMVDPKNGGGRILPEKTPEELVRDITLDGKRYLAYPAVPIDVAILRGTYADRDGNLSMKKEALFNDCLVQAIAARARRGLVIAQVEKVVDSINAREVLVPGTLVNCVVESSSPQMHEFGYFNGYDPVVTGEVRCPTTTHEMPMNIRKLIARRATLELRNNMVVNLGIGIPDGVASVASEENCLNNIILTTEPGVHGGQGLLGHNFGPAKNYTALVSMDHQFDFYNGGGLDIAFLGNAETDEFGNVNVTRMGDKLTGPGGFVDITQSTKQVNLMGSFTAKGLEVEVRDGKLHILKEGKVKKFVKNVREITFSNEQAKILKQKVNYITDRCVFTLTDDGLELVEIAPGVDLEKDILANMEFEPIIKKPIKLMDERIFRPELMNLRQSNFN